MKGKYPKTSCLNCGENHSYTVKERKAIFKYKNYKIPYLEQYAVCDNCGKEVWSGDIDDKNTHMANLAIRAKLEEIIKEKNKQIKELMEGKYIPATIAKQSEKLRDEFEKETIRKFSQKLIDMLTERAELINFSGDYAEFMFSIYDLQESIKQLEGEL